MWQIVIPIPNWTGILTGFCPGVIIGIAVMLLIAWWGNSSRTKGAQAPPEIIPYEPLEIVA